MIRRIGYWLGVVGVCAAAAWLVWRSWHAVPARDPESLTDRLRVLVTVLALAVLPWTARSRGVFGPVGASVTARLVRVTACAALCGVGVVIVRVDSHARSGGGIGSGQFSWPREVGGLVLLVVLFAVPFVVYRRWPRVEGSTLWCLIGVAGIVVAAIMPVQTLALVYVAGILFATSQRSPMLPVTLAVGADAGLAAAPITHALVDILVAGGNPLLALLALMVPLFTLAAVAAMAAAWLGVSGGTAHNRRAARIRQGVLAGLVSGSACGLLVPLLAPVLLFMLVAAPVVGLAGGALGAAIAADHPRARRSGVPVDRGPFAVKS